MPSPPLTRFGESPVLRNALTWFGRALAILGIAFVGLRLRAYGDEIDLAGLGWEGWAALGGLSLLYGAAGVMLGLAWWHLLGHFGALTSRRWAVRVYGLSQISKYVPGNIFHLAARQSRGMAAGISGWAVAKSAAWELGLLAMGGAVFGLLVLPLLAEAVPVLLSALLFAAALGAAAVLLRRLVGAGAVRAFAWQVAFLAASGLLFLGLLVLLGELGAGERWGIGHDGAGDGGGVWLTVLGAYILAWLAGLVTPGSPAGLGVRELVLLLLLEGLVDEAGLVQAVVLARLVSALGDGAFFLGALTFGKGAGGEWGPIDESRPAA